MRSLSVSPTAVALLVCCALLFVPSALAASGSSAALSVRVTPAKDECFFEQVPTAGVKVFLHFVVTTGAELDIDAMVYGPDGGLVWETEKSRESRVLFKSKLPGLHKICFSNRVSTITSKTVAFHVQVGDTLAAEANRDPMERSIMNIYQGMVEIKNEQSFLRAREGELRDTAESTHNHILVWSLIEIGLIVVMGIGHVTYLRKLCESRRVV